MKTITEISGIKLQETLKREEQLKSEGKTPEEITTLITQELKLEGDKLAFFLTALEMARSKPMDLKRIIVSTLNEGEKPPQYSQEKEQKYFLAEYFPPVRKEQPHHGNRHGNDPRDKRGKKGGRGGRGRDARGGRDAGDSKPGRDQESRGFRPGRPPRQPDRKDIKIVVVNPAVVNPADTSAANKPSG